MRKIKLKEFQWLIAKAKITVVRKNITKKQLIIKKRVKVLTHGKNNNQLLSMSSKKLYSQYFLKFITLS